MPKSAFLYVLFLPWTAFLVQCGVWLSFIIQMRVTLRGLKRRNLMNFAVGILLLMVYWTYLQLVMVDRVSFKACKFVLYAQHRLHLITVEGSNGDIIGDCWRLTVKGTIQVGAYCIFQVEVDKFSVAGRWEHASMAQTLLLVICMREGAFPLHLWFNVSVQVNVKWKARIFCSWLISVLGMIKVKMWRWSTG